MSNQCLSGHAGVSCRPREPVSQPGVPEGQNGSPALRLGRTFRSGRQDHAGHGAIPQCSTSEGSRTWRKQALTRSLQEIESLVQSVLSLIEAEHLFTRHLQRTLADVNAAEGKAAAGAEIEPVETGSPMAVLSA
jgi:hypothetical protein